jgi:hypothetical protein
MGEKKKIEVKGDKEVKDDSRIPMNSVFLLFFYHIQLTFLKKIILSRGRMPPSGCKDTHFLRSFQTLAR